METVGIRLSAVDDGTSAVFDRVAAGVGRVGTAATSAGQASAQALGGLGTVLQGLNGQTSSLAGHFAALNAQAGRNAFNGMASSLGASSAAIAEANRNLGAMRGAASSAGQGVREVADNMDGLRTMSSLVGRALGAAFAVHQVLEFRSAILDSQISIDKLRNTLSYGLGSSAAGREIDYLRKTTGAMGLEFESTSQLYAKFAAASRGTAIEGRATKNIFEAVGKAATVMGLGVGDVQGVFLALTQIMSKGTVQAEEIRGQLGERLPGAFQIAARAMGVTTSEFSKLLETGQVMSSDFLPKFAAQMEVQFAGSFEKASQSAQASVNRLTNSWNALKTAIADDVGVGKFFATGNTALSRGIDNLTQSIRGMAQAKGLEEFFYSGFYSVEALDLELKIAKDSLADLDRQLARAPSDIYAKSAAHDLDIYIAKLERAKRRQDELTGTVTVNQGPGNVSDIAAQYPTRSQSIATEQERINKVRAGMQSVLGDVSGVSASFNKHLSALKAGLDDGLISQDRYVEAVKALIKKEGGARQEGADHIKTINDARFALAKAQSEQITALMSVEAAAQARINDLAFKGGAVDMEAYYTRRALLEIQGIDRKETMLRQELKEAVAAQVGLKKVEDKLRVQERVAKIETQLIELGKERIKVDGPDDQALRAWERLKKVVEDFDQAAARVNSDLYNQGLKLGQGLEEARLKLQYQFDINGAMNGELALLDLRYEREKKILELKLAQSTLSDKEKEDLRQLLAQDNGAKVTQLYADQLKAQLDSVDQVAHTLWTNITENGKSAAEEIGAALKHYVYDMLYQITVKRWIFDVGVNSSGGIGAVSNAATGISGLGGLFNANTALNSATNLAGFGSGSSVFTQFATSGVGQSLGLSAGVDAIGGLGTASTALTGAGSAFAAAMPWIGGALLLSSLFSGGGFKSSDTTGESAISVDALGNTTRNPNTRYADSTSSLTTVGQLRDSYLTTAAALGIKAAATEFFAGGNTGAQGENPNFALSGGVVGKGGYSIGETPVSDEAMQTAAARAVFATLQNSELPKYLAGIFDGIDPAAQSQEQIAAALETAKGFKTLHDSLLALPFDKLTDLSYAAYKAMTDAAGGIEAFTNSLSTYYDKFYSDNEKTAQLTQNVSKVFTDLGLVMPKVDDAARTAFRGIVDSLDPTTEAGQKAYAALIGVSGAFDQLATSAESAAKAEADKTIAAAKASSDAQIRNIKEQIAWLDRFDLASGAITQRELDLRNDLASATDATTRALIEQVYAQEDLNAAAQAAADSAKKAADDLKSAWASLTNSITDEVKRLRGLITGTGSQSFASVQAQFATATAQARAGDQTAAGLLPELSRTLDTMALTNSASLVELQRFRARTASSLEGTGSAISGISASQYAAATAAASPAQVTVGGGAASAIRSALDEGFFAAYRMPNGVYSKSYISDATRISELTAARAYLLPLFNDGRSTLADIAAAAKAKGDTQQTIAEAMGYALSDVQKEFAAVGIPAFARGTNRVPQDMLAIIHQDEAIIPRAYNPAAGGQQGNARLEALVEHLTARVNALCAAADRGNENTARVADATEGRNPQPILVQVVPA